MLGGYTFSEGVAGDSVFIPGVGTFNSIDLKSGGTFGLTFGVVMENGGEVGFSYSRQMSELSLSGINSLVLGDMAIDSYHGYFAYNFLPDSAVRPYVSFGLGATDYGSVAYSGPLATGTIAGPVRFSAQVGAGVKAWANDNFGFRAGFVYTPTYITSEAAGWWCDPYWGCYLVGTASTRTSSRSTAAWYSASAARAATTARFSLGLFPSGNRPFSLPARGKV